MKEQNIDDEYKNFLDANEEELDASFGKMHNFQTNTRGLKVHGVYSTPQQEAELRCKLLREVDPNHSNVGPVGMWMPWEPEAYKTGRVEYLEEELNQLMSETTRTRLLPSVNLRNVLKGQR